MCIIMYNNFLRFWLRYNCAKSNPVFYLKGSFCESKNKVTIMKLVIAIVNSDDAGDVGSELLQNGFPATKMASTGGFLRMGNTTFLVGVPEHDVDGVIEIIRKNSSKRMQLVSNSNAYSADNIAQNVQVTVGGATVFVIDVDRFVKL